MGLHKELISNPLALKRTEYYYNNSQYSVFDNKFAPHQVQHEKELETWYIKKEDNKLMEDPKLQRTNEFFNYEKKI
jgi:hypothetical protein